MWTWYENIYPQFLGQQKKKKDKKNLTRHLSI